MDLKVNHDKRNQKFVANVENKLNTLDYEKVGEEVLDYISTYVHEDLRRKGIGHKLAKKALDYAQKHDYKVIPSCPFIKTVVDENKEKYSELILHE